MTAYEGVSVARSRQPRQDLDRGRFAGAIRSDIPEYLSAIHLEADVIQRPGISIVFGQISKVDGWIIDHCLLIRLGRLGADCISSSAGLLSVPTRQIGARRGYAGYEGNVELYLRLAHANRNRHFGKQ